MRYGLGAGGEEVDNYGEEKEKHRNKYSRCLFMHCPGKECPIKLPRFSSTFLGLFLLRKSIYQVIRARYH